MSSSEHRWLGFIRSLGKPDVVTAIFGWCVILLQIAVFIILIASIKPANWTPDDIEKTTGSFEHLVTALGIILGGIWVYYRFFRERVFKIRLELDVSAELVKLDKNVFIRAKLKIKNTGLSRIDFGNGTAHLIVSGYNKNLNQEYLNKMALDPLRVSELKPIKVFINHEWIESGETIKDEVFFAINTNQIIAWHLHFRVVANSSNLFIAQTENNAFHDICVISLSDSSENEETGFIEKLITIVKGELAK